MSLAPDSDLDPVQRPPRLDSIATLALGTRLRDYEITGVVHTGSFATVYRAWDHGLQRNVAVKEYLPVALATRVAGSATVVVVSENQRAAFAAGLKGFMEEARLLARFAHPALVEVYRFWEDNRTAYRVMPLLEGPTLRAALAELDHVPTEAELRSWLRPLLDAVTLLHDSGTWHGSVSPDTVVLTASGPVLLAMGLARRAVETLRGAPAAALTPGFGAPEQYGAAVEATCGPWTDLYALAAVLYTAIAGTEPAPAPDRVDHDRVAPISLLAAGLYGQGFLDAVDAALAVQPERRPRDHEAFRARMGGIDAPPQAATLGPKQDPMQAPFLLPGASAREITIPDPPQPVLAEPATPAARPAGDGETEPSRAAAASEPRAALPTIERVSPSWMSAAGARAMSKGTLYKVLGIAFALIAATALLIQLSARPGAQAMAGAPAASAASTTAARLPPTAAPTQVAARPPTAEATPVATLAPTPAATPVATLAPTPAATLVTAAPATTALAPAAPASPAPGGAGQQPRCIEILQRASLEAISAADTQFFKKECR